VGRKITNKTRNQGGGKKKEPSAWGKKGVRVGGEKGVRRKKKNILKEQERGGGRIRSPKIKTGTKLDGVVVHKNRGKKRD